MNNLPSEYRNKIKIDSRLNSITGLKDKRYAGANKIPEEIQTIKDLFIKRHKLPKWINHESEYNVIEDIMNSDICIDDVSDMNINTEEEFRLCLFALVSNADVLCENGERHSIKELWGSDIVNADLNNQILINKKPYFSTEHNSLPKPDIPVNNLILFEYNKSKTRSIYAFTTADKKIIKDAYYEGFPINDYIITSFNTNYVDIVCSVLKIDSIKDNMDLVRVTKNGLLLIESRDLDLNGLIAPHKIPRIKDPWKDFKINQNYQILTI